MKKILVLIALITTALTLYACGKKPERDGEVRRPEITGVRIEKVITKDIDRYYETSGSVKAETVSIISSKVMGSVTSIPVQIGDRVKKGQLLLTIDDSDLSKKVKAAEAGYEEAASGLAMARENNQLTTTTYNRYKQLFEEKALARQEMDEMETKKTVAESQLKQAEAGLQRAEAAVMEAKAYLAYTRITSPVEGVVSEKKIDLGTMAAPGMPLLTIEDPSSYTVNINADESLFPRIRKGMRVGVRVDSLGLNAAGTVSEIAQAVDPLSRTFLVKVAVRNKGMRSGFYATVSIPDGRSTVIAVPAKAIVTRGELTGVYVVNENNIANLRLIKPGKAIGNMREVLSGLSGSERIITEGIENAVDGGVVTAQAAGRQEGNATGQAAAHSGN